MRPLPRILFYENVRLPDNDRLVRPDCVVVNTIKYMILTVLCCSDRLVDRQLSLFNRYEGWNFNSGNYLFTTDTK